MLVTQLTMVIVSAGTTQTKALAEAEFIVMLLCRLGNTSWELQT